MADSIAGRASATVAPSQWLPYSVLRGLLNPGVDAVMVRDRRVHHVVRELESRVRSDR